MRLFSVPALLAAALFSVVVALPFLPFAQNEAGPFFLEVTLTSTTSGAAQLYFDSGAGMSEAGSSRTEVARSVKPRVYRLGLPEGRYQALRFDPIDRTANMTIDDARIVSAAGRVLRRLPASDFQPANQIATFKAEGNRVILTTTVNADDPELQVALHGQLVAKATFLDWVRTFPLAAVGVFFAVAAVLFLLDRTSEWRVIGAELARRAERWPKATLGIAAALAVIVSAYPVVFLGKSFVSPNLGTILLYDAYPTLPGYDEHEIADVQLSDIGAIMWQHVPFSMVQHRALARGELPLWNRDNAMGTPLLAQGQSMFGDPLHFLVIAANGAAWAWDLKYLLAKWLFALGLALVVWKLLAPARPAMAAGNPAPASGRRAALIASGVVAVAAPCIGFFLYRLNHPAYFSLCYAPWPLYCWIRLGTAATRRALAAAAVGLIVANLALMNSGTAKEAYMLLLTMNLAGAVVVALAASSWRDRLARLAVAAWAGVIFVLLTTPIWATFLHTLHNAYTSYNAASAYQLQPAMLLGLFDELFFRPLMANDRLLDPSLNFLLLLGLLYFLATLRASFVHRAVMGIALASLLPLALAFGLVPPDWIVRWPILGNVAHLDNTFGCALIVLWSVLAGVGFFHALRRLGETEGKGDLAVVALLLFGLVFAWIGFGQAVHRPVLGPTTFTVHKAGESLPVPAFIWADLLVLLAGSALFWGVTRRIVRRRAASGAAVILLATALVALLWRHALHAPAVGFRGYVQEPTLRVDLQAKSEAVAFMRAAVKTEPARGFGLHGNFFPGWTAAYGLETVHGPDAIMSRYVRELAEASGIERMWDWRWYVAPENVAAARPFLDVLNVRWYFDLASDQGLLGKSLKLAKVADLDVYESPSAWPRAFFTNRVFTYADAHELVTRLRTGDGRPLAAVQNGETVALPAPLLPLANANAAPRIVTAATHYQLTENTTAFDLHADGPGVAVLTESWWPDDFRVEVNGHRAPVLRVNHAFKAVAIPAAGDYHVRFSYWPHNFLRSLLCSALGAVLLAISCWYAARRPA